MWYYFDFPLMYYEIEMTNITYFSDGVKALQSKLTKIGANKHWYSTEQILKIGIYNRLITEKGFIDILDKSIVYNIRHINKKIIDIYFKPSKQYNRMIRNDFKMRFNISMDEHYISIHLRIGDVDNSPFKKYINKTEIEQLINCIKKYKIHNKVVIVSDSISIKKHIKKELGNYIYTDFKLPCHSRNLKCINQSMNDIMILKNSLYLILTRGSTFSLFSSYFSKCEYDKIIYIGHDYEHSNYYS